MDEQNGNGQEQNNQKSVGSQMANKAVQAGKDAAKNEFKKKVVSKALVAAAPIIIKIVLIIVIVSILGAFLFLAFDWLLDIFTSNKVDESTSDLIGEYCTIEKDGIKIDKDLAIKSMFKMLKEEIDLDIDEIGLAVGKRGELSGEWSDEYYEKVKNSEAAGYLYNYLKASLATELPYIPGSDPEVQGNIKIKRKKSNADKSVLREKAIEGTMIEDNEKAVDLTYMWYDDFKKLLESDDIAEKEKSLKYFSLDDAWNLCISKYYKEVVNDEIKVYDVIEVKIPYRTMVSQYSVPFVFLINLLLATNNANYVDKVADLIAEDSEIEFTIFDTISTDKTTYTYTATQHNKTKDEETGEYSESTSEIKQVTVTTIEVNTIKANVTKAKTWILDQETKYAIKPIREEPLGEEGVTKESSESEPEGEGSWKDPIKEHWYEEIITAEWIKEGDTKTTFIPSRFLGLWKNDTGVYTKGAQYNPKGIVVSYFLVGDKLLDKPVTNILINEEGFYSYFEENVSTQIHAELMRYLVHYYKTGEELDLSDLDGLFDPDEFIDSMFDDMNDYTYASSLKEFIHSFEGTPKEKNGQYVVFDDGFGNPTVGWGIYIKSHYGRFSARGLDASKLKVGDLVNKSIVDSIEDEIILEYRTGVAQRVNRIRINRISN